MSSLLNVHRAVLRYLLHPTIWHFSAFSMQQPISVLLPASKLGHLQSQWCCSWPEVQSGHRAIHQCPVLFHATVCCNQRLFSNCKESCQSKRCYSTNRKVSFSKLTEQALKVKNASVENHAWKLCHNEFAQASSQVCTSHAAFCLNGRHHSGQLWQLVCIPGAMLAHIHIIKSSM